MLYHFAIQSRPETRDVKGEQRSLIAKRGRILQDEVSSNVPFPCNVTGGRSSKVPESVNRLRPGDIDVIAAMGDSLTAGNGIFSTNLFQIGIENRGVSASIGGEGTWRTYLTLPNILKEYNPNLMGYSLGDSLLPHQASQLNVAEAGAMSRDMPFMARYLINKIKRSPKINIKKHWKLISLMIGSNDFCSDICHISSPWSVLEAHRTDLVKTLRILRDNLPRTIIALHLTPNLKALVDSRKRNNSLKCYITTIFECPCLLALQFQDRQSEYYEIMRRWQKLEEEIADYSEFHKNDFTVVALPILKNVTIPLADNGVTDLSYLAFDCFHVTQKTNALYANGQWNNLLEPYGNKSDSWSPLYEKFLCPTTARPFLITHYSNSSIKGVHCAAF
ncbi:phospholipase B1, membrane-associated isoform X2 [Ptiloglossa arizonensis]|uniref:phospholipase B1, membrane-associated isoform X2 n=1 Tax=Ptiloglossa arizonensis TaxID=3350558 RepID=UPI003FA0FB39